MIIRVLLVIVCSSLAECRQHWREQNINRKTKCSIYIELFTTKVGR